MAEKKRGVRKMPVAPKPTGKLTPHGVEDKTAARMQTLAVAKRGDPKKIKTPRAKMPNNSVFHVPKRDVASGSHMATAGGVGKKSHPPNMLMARKAKKNAAKRKEA